AQGRGQLVRRPTGPTVAALGVALIDLPAREGGRPGRDQQGAEPGQQVHFGAAGRVPEQDHRGRVSRGRRREPSVPDVPGPGGQLRRNAKLAQESATSAISSTSTGVSSGSTATPTALRACLPASPNTSVSSSLAPLMTCRWAGE